jgi:hypothetical protein
LGYKNDVDMLNLFGEAELIHLSTENMPANNLAVLKVTGVYRYMVNWGD